VQGLVATVTLFSVKSVSYPRIRLPAMNSKILIIKRTRLVSMASTMAEELGHLKNHVKYPANRAQVVAACNNMSDVPAADKDWVSKNLPEGTYQSADQVVAALLKKA
jgi:hypothetical protein